MKVSFCVNISFRARPNVDYQPEREFFKMLKDDEIFEKIGRKLSNLCKIEILGREKNVEIVDLVKSFPTRIWSQNRPRSLNTY